MSRKKPIILKTEELEKVNHATISRLFNDSLKLLGEDFDANNVLVPKKKRLPTKTELMLCVFPIL